METEKKTYKVSFVQKELSMYEGYVEAESEEEAIAQAMAGRYIDGTERAWLEDLDDPEDFEVEER